MSFAAIRRLTIYLAFAWAFVGPLEAQSMMGPPQFAPRVLQVHNIERRAIGSLPVAWDQALASQAAVYAGQLAATGLFKHSDRKARRGIGENLWMGTKGAFSIETMVGGWVSEKRSYTAGVFPDVSRTGNWADVAHYTQLIWPETRRVGCALASNARYDYLVCHYAPAGNIDGRALP